MIHLSINSVSVIIKHSYRIIYYYSSLTKFHISEVNRRHFGCWDNLRQAFKSSSNPKSPIYLSSSLATSFCNPWLAKMFNWLIIYKGLFSSPELNFLITFCLSSVCLPTFHIFNISPELLSRFQPNLTQSTLRQRELKVVKIKDHTLLQG